MMAPAAGGASYSGWDPAITAAAVAITTTTMTNDTVNSNGGGNSRRISIMKCPQGSKCKYEFIWNFTDSGGQCSLGYSYQGFGDYWIGTNEGAGTYHGGAVLYSDGSQWAYIVGGTGNNPALAVTSGIRWAVLCDNSNAAAPTMQVTDGTNSSGVLALKPSTDQYAYFEVDAVTTGKGGRLITNPASFTITNAGYGALV